MQQERWGESSQHKIKWYQFLVNVLDEVILQSIASDILHFMSTLQEQKELVHLKKGQEYSKWYK